MLSDSVIIEVALGLEETISKSGSAMSALPVFLEHELIHATFPTAGMELGERKSSLQIEIKYLSRRCDLEWIAPKPVYPVCEDRHPSFRSNLS